MPLPRLSNHESIGGMHYWVQLFAPGDRNPVDGSTLPPSPAYAGWADIWAAQGAEFDKAQQIAQTCRHVVKIPYHIGVTENMTVVFERRTFQIDYVDDRDERKFFLYLYCSEIGQNAGSQT